MKPQLKIAILDDQKIFVDSLKMAIEIDHESQVVATFTTGKSLLASIETLEADILILDIMLPDLSGLLVFDKIQTAQPSLKIIGMSGLVQPDAFISLWQQNIHGLIHKNDGIMILKQAFEKLTNNERYLSDTLKEKMQNTEIKTVFANLTNREKEILIAIVDGLQTKEIAEKLGIAVKTARCHRENLMKKIEAHSTSDLIRFALQCGLLNDLTH